MSGAEVGERRKCVVTREEIEGFLQVAMELAKANRAELRDVLEAARIVELRRGNTLRADGEDYRDERLAAVAAVLQDAADSLTELARRAGG